MDIIKRAISAYSRRCQKQGFVYQEPPTLSDTQKYKGKEYVVLRNVWGVLAVYRIRNNGILRHLSKYPSVFDSE